MSEKKLSEKDEEIIANEVAGGVFSWFRASDTRLKMMVYILWSYALWIMIESTTHNQGIAAITSAIPQGIIFGLYVYAICNSGPLQWIIDKLRKISYSGLLLNPLVVLPSWFFGWPAEKIYSLFVYRFTSLSRGIVYLHKREFRKAVFELENAKVGNHDTEGQKILHSARGDAYEGVGAYDKAAIAYETALQFDPEDSDLKSDLAYCLAMRNDFDEALKLFREILQSSPEQTTPYLGISRCYLNMGMYEDALAYLKQALALAPQDPVTHKMLAEAHIGLGDEVTALQEAELSLTLNPQPNIAEEAQEIIDHIKYTPSSMSNDGQQVPAAISETHVASSPNKAQEIPVAVSDEIEEGQSQDALARESFSQPAGVTVEDKNMFFSDSVSNTEINRDSEYGHASVLREDEDKESAIKDENKRSNQIQRITKLIEAGTRHKRYFIAFGLATVAAISFFLIPAFRGSLSSPPSRQVSTVEALHVGMDLAGVMQKIPQLKQVLHEAQKLQEISPRYQEQVTIANDVLKTAQDKKRQHIEAYSVKIQQLRRYSQSEIDTAMGALKKSNLSKEQTIVAELIAKHFASLSENNAPKPNDWLLDFEHRFQ